ncbi:hypothetical protein CYMTET_45526 [Cymbomonas tetramitiformis]|uniref:Uncharacterized protein n=1 Tax=Cymbomonas tetramitiformis TaxID=36881 RepID=A0AAE0EZM0_9CHLO|nr:hypothetical protein CYMTET_45526 [Cymbomonas tetramitiformis]
MPPKSPVAKRQRTEEPDWLSWALDTGKKESEGAHYHPDQHGSVCAHGNVADLKEFVREGPWCSEWWIWRRFGGLVTYFKSREDNLRKELSGELSKLQKAVIDLGLQVQGTVGKAAFSPPQAAARADSPPPDVHVHMTTPNFGPGNTASLKIFVLTYWWWQRDVAHCLVNSEQACRRPTQSDA